MARKRQPAQPKPKPNLRYFIVNRAGTVHEVTEEHARMRLQQVGYRMATRAEVKEYLDRNGNQRHDDPIAPPWTPDPEPMEMDGLTGLDLAVSDEPNQ